MQTKRIKFFVLQFDIFAVLIALF